MNVGCGNRCTRAHLDHTPLSDPVLGQKREKAEPESTAERWFEP